MLALNSDGDEGSYKTIEQAASTLSSQEARQTIQSLRGLFFMRSFPLHHVKHLDALAKNAG